MESKLKIEYNSILMVDENGLYLQPKISVYVQAPATVQFITIPIHLKKE